MKSSSKMVTSLIGRYASHAKCPNKDISGKVGKVVSAFLVSDKVRGSVKYQIELDGVLYDSFLQGGFYDWTLVPESETCPEGGIHEYSADLEYDRSGKSIDCEKCGELRPEDRKEVEDD